MGVRTRRVIAARNTMSVPIIRIGGGFKRCTHKDRFGRDRHEGIKDVEEVLEEGHPVVPEPDHQFAQEQAGEDVLESLSSPSAGYVCVVIA